MTVLSSENLYTGEEIDNRAIDAFAQIMKDKMAKSREKGRGGWDKPDLISPGFLSMLLKDHCQKDDPVDVAIIAMMLHMRGAKIGDDREIFKARIAFERYGHTGPWNNAPHMPEVVYTEIPSVGGD